MLPEPATPSNTVWSDAARIVDFPRRFSVIQRPAARRQSALALGKLRLPALDCAPRAGVAQWQSRSFPSLRRGFDSLHPLHAWLAAAGRSAPGVPRLVRRRRRRRKGKPGLGQIDVSVGAPATYPRPSDSTYESAA